MGPSSNTAGTGWPGLVERPARGEGDWPDGVWAVLVHGAMDRGAGMAHVARRLVDAPTLRYDRRGYGRAVSLGTGDLVRHVDDLVALVADRPVVLFGHSFGGLVTAGAAATGRLDVRGLVTYEMPTPWIPTWAGWEATEFGSLDDPGGVAEGFMRSTIGAAHYDALPERTRAARRAEGPSLIADLDPVLRAGPPFDPRRIGVRSLFAAGDRSPASYAAGAAWMAARVPRGSVRRLAGAPHDAPMTHPDAIAGMIREIADPHDPADDHGEERHAVAG